MLQMDFTKKHLLTSFFLKTCVVCSSCSHYIPREHKRLYPQFRNPTKSLRALCPKTAKNEIFLVRTDFLPRVGRYASIMPPYPHLGLQTTAPPKRLAHP